MTDNPVYLSAMQQLLGRSLTISALLQATRALLADGASNLAVDLYKRWIAAEESNPALYGILFNCALLLQHLGDLAGARDMFERSISLKPDFVQGRRALGSLYSSAGHSQQAIAQWTLAVDQPVVISGAAVTNTLSLLKHIGAAYQAGRQFPELAALLRRGLELDPGEDELVAHTIALRLQQCEWPITAVPGIDRKALMRKMGTFQLLLYTDDPLLHLGSALPYNREAVGYHDPCPDVRPRPANPGRLRIGYLSADLTSHATGYLMSEVFELHDRKKVELFAYYCGSAAADPNKARINAAVEHWVDIANLNDEAAARRIAADGIDILVDLHGNTRGARTRLLAMRPAPIIVNWIAYPATMATPYHHYIIADEWIIPKDHEIYYTEKVMRLPCYQPNDRKREIGPRPSRAEFGLPEDAIVYCCFNGAIKITRFIVERWMTILSRVPGSVLWLLDNGEEMRQRILSVAAARGIGAERLVFTPMLPRARHLARYPLADLFLDTAPCGAHTTASDALWMSVPILTVSGRSFASRVCGSLARAAGLPEAVCDSPDAYVERAVALGQNRKELQRQKERLARQRDTCTLFDMPGLVRHLEGLYRRMWKEFHQGKLPRPDLRNLDVYFEIGLDTTLDAVEGMSNEDYTNWYRERLAAWHRRCPIPPDNRLWTEADIARTEEHAAPSPKSPAKRLRVTRRAASKKTKKQGRKRRF